MQHREVKVKFRGLKRGIKGDFRRKLTSKTKNYDIKVVHQAETFS